MNESSEDVVLKGTLIKKNWYGGKKYRFFKLFSSGRIDYYNNESATKLKDWINTGSNCNVRKIGRKEITFFCNHRKKSIVLTQP